MVTGPVIALGPVICRAVAEILFFGLGVADRQRKPMRFPIKE